MISIVIPTYNSIAKMDLTLESLRAIPEKVPHEVIFVDDQSKDDTFDRLSAACEENENWKIFRLAENSAERLSHVTMVWNKRPANSSSSLTPMTF